MVGLKFERSRVRPDYYSEEISRVPSAGYGIFVTGLGSNVGVDARILSGQLDPFQAVPGEDVGDGVDV